MYKKLIKISSKKCKKIHPINIKNIVYYKIVFFIQIFFFFLLLRHVYKKTYTQYIHNIYAPHVFTCFYIIQSIAFYGVYIRYKHKKAPKK